MPSKVLGLPSKTKRSRVSISTGTSSISAMERGSWRSWRSTRAAVAAVRAPLMAVVAVIGSAPG